MSVYLYVCLLVRLSVCLSAKGVRRANTHSYSVGGSLKVAPTFRLVQTRNSSHTRVARSPVAQGYTIGARWKTVDGDVSCARVDRVGEGVGDVSGWGPIVNVVMNSSRSRRFGAIRTPIRNDTFSHICSWSGNRVPASKPPRLLCYIFRIGALCLFLCGACMLSI